jgi:hypothetical protein
MNRLTMKIQKSLHIQERSSMSNGIRNSEASGAGKTIALIAAAVIAGSLFWGCEGSATQTTNGQCLHGTLVNASGAPVAGALVKAWPSAAVVLGDPNGAPAAMAETDAEGRYALKGLAAGEYNLFGDKGQGASTVLIPRVAYASVELDLGEDTLTPPGTIIGRVMANGAPLAGVFCWLPGSSRVAMTDSLGGFALDRVPEGTYLLRYTAMGYAAASDGSVMVASGEITTQPTKSLVFDLASQPPTPQGLAAAYDTATGLVSLTWTQPDVADLAGYIIQSFPGNDTSEAATVEKELKGAHPAWVDTTARGLFEQQAMWRGQDTGTLHYRIKAVDFDGNRSHGFSAPLAVSIRRNALQHTAATLIEGSGDDDAPRCRDTLVFKAAFTNPVMGMGQLVLNIFGWYAGSPNRIATYHDKSPALGVNADTTVWSPGMVQFLPLSSKPATVDSAAWFNGGNIAGISDPRKPDSLRVILDVAVFGVMTSSVRWIQDVRTDANGCYLVSASRPAEPGE